MHTAFTAVSAIVPSLLLVAYFHSRDVYPEPFRATWLTFGLGVLSVLPVLAVGVPVNRLLAGFGPDNAYLSGAAGAFLSAAIPEECCKFLVVYFYAARHKAFDEPMDGVVYGVVASLGFATLENIMYTSHGGLMVAVLRAVTAVPGHAFYGAVMGYFVGQARFNQGPGRGWLIVQALVWPILLHGLYDLPLFIMGTLRLELFTAGFFVLLGLTLAVLAFSGVWAVVLTRRLRREQIKGAVKPPDPGREAETESPTVRTAARVLLWVGGAAASGGGLVLLGIGVAIALNEYIDFGWRLLAVGVGLGLVPFLAGTAVFMAGLRRLPKRHRNPGERGTDE
jgi:RsiW-degrading membrane proteinase PrsW (M82 family)